MHKYIELTIPSGTAIQMHADGIYRFLIDEKDLIKVRDWAANLANQLTRETLEFIDRRKKEEQQKMVERQMRVRRVTNETDDLLATEKRINSEEFGPLIIPDEDLPIPPLVELPPNRIVQTDKGPLEVAFDVTDEELTALGYTPVNTITASNTETENTPSDSHTL